MSIEPYDPAAEYASDLLKLLVEQQQEAPKSLDGVLADLSAKAYNFHTRLYALKYWQKEVQIALQGNSDHDVLTAKRGLNEMRTQVWNSYLTLITQLSLVGYVFLTDDYGSPETAVEGVELSNRPALAWYTSWAVQLPH